MTARLSDRELEVLARTIPDRDELARVAAVVEAILLARVHARLYPMLVSRRFERDWHEVGTS